MYKRQGFEETGEIFEEVGISHIKMTKQIKTPNQIWELGQFPYLIRCFYLFSHFYMGNTHFFEYFPSF
ncbi:hypothetical protein PT076_08965, partial [Erysipelothrix rhusiopathiae]|nr:hypothetical protein [Erysipelothrix rhusiopathiae]